MWLPTHEQVGATAAIVAAVVAYVEYRLAAKGRKVDLAIQATRAWDESLDEYTWPAVQLARNSRDDPNTLKALHNGLPLLLDPVRSKELAVAHWATAEGVVPASHTLRLRQALIHLLNALESVALLHEKNRADRGILDRYFGHHFAEGGTIDGLLPYMNLHGPASWEPARTACANRR